MAVQNYFTNHATTPGIGEKLEPGAGPQEIVTIIGYAAPAVADDDGSTYLIAKSVPSSFRPVSITVKTTAITNGTDYDLGVYQAGTGVVVTKDLFMDGQTLASASRTLDGLANVSLANLGARKTIAELLSLTPTTAKSSYDIVLTANTVGSAAGDVVVEIRGYAA